MKTDFLLEGLTEPQREAVTHADGPLLVLAGPGSGKTRVITHRAAYLAMTVTRPYHILAITFTNKAAGEMAERILSLDVGRGITCCTFHSFCARILRLYAERAGIDPNFSIYDTTDQLSAMKEAVKRADLSTDNFPPRGMLSAVSKLKNDMILPDQYEAQADGWKGRQIAKLYQVYNKVLADHNAFDFDDLLVRMALLLGNDPQLREELEDRYRYVLVDEYQDTNHAQYLIARGLALKNENLCATGDPDQSIYGWRGANLNNILQFEEDFPTSRVVRLEQNYRSTPQILTAADALIGCNQQRKAKSLWTQNADGQAIRIAECEDSQAEATFVADQILQYVNDGGTYNQIAVFYRINAMSRTLEAALRDRRIPYQIARGVEFFNRKEIRDVLGYLKVAVNPRDLTALQRIINTPTRGIGKTTVERLFAYAEKHGITPLDAIAEIENIDGMTRAARYLQAFAQLMTDLRITAEHGTCQDAVEFVTRNSGLLAMWSNQDDEEALENVSELVNAAAEYDRRQENDEGSLADWLHQISLVSDADAIDEGAGVVMLMTLHAAKGLEFNCVFVTGVEEGLLPHERSQGNLSELEEERRLFFVGMTRARQCLTITSARWRDFRGISHRTSLSPFLHELPEQGIERLRVDAEGQSRYDEDPDEQPMSASALDYIHWRQGQYVRHPTFGVGTVNWIRPSGQKTYAGISFPAYGEKTLVLEYAKLEVIEFDE